MCGLAAPASMHAELDRDTASVGESVTLTLTFEGVSPKAPPNLPALSNVQANYSGQSSSFTIVNNETSRSVSFTYTLAPTQPGEITIPAMQAQVDGQVVSSQPLKLKVVKSQAEAGGAAQNNTAFAKLIVPKTEVYVGESFPVEIDLYFQNVDQNSLHMPQLQAEGFSLGQMPRPSQSRTQSGNAVYNLLIFKTSATAAKAGNLSLGLADYNLTVLVPTGNPRRRDPFDPFGVFGGPAVQGIATTLHCEPQPMRVLPLPMQNVPETFKGAVGSFSLTVTAGPTNLAVGDPITLKVQISGQGMLDAVSLPPQPEWRDFKAYAPSSKVDSSDPLGLSGVKSFEQVIIPQNHEIKMLPPFQFSFFDPAQKKYRTLSGPAIPLSVRPTASASAPVSTNAPSDKTQPPVDDIIHIKPRLDEIATARLPLIERPWFLAMQAFPVVGWLSLLVARRRRESLENNPRLRRQREVAQRIREGLKELHSRAPAQDVEAFFASLFRLLQEQLGERLDLPASAITEAVIDERLRGRNLPDQTLLELRELFHNCNLARYAPHKINQELPALIPRLEAVLEQLRELK